MVLLILTDPLSDRLAVLLPLLPSELAAQITAHLDANDAAFSDDAEPAVSTVSHELLVKVVQACKGTGSSSPTLASLLRLTDIHAPPLSPRIRSPALISILSKIQLAQDEASYAAMTSIAGPKFISLLPLNDIHDPKGQGGSLKNVQEEWKEVQREVGAILNVGASMLAVGVAVWWVGGGRSYAAQLCLSLGGAALIGMVEAFLYYRFFTRESRVPLKPVGGGMGKVLKFD